MLTTGKVGGKYSGYNIVASTSFHEILCKKSDKRTVDLYAGNVCSTECEAPPTEKLVGL